MSNTLTLDPSTGEGTEGCIPDQLPWKPGPWTGKRNIVIKNDTDHDQTLSNIDAGLLAGFDGMGADPDHPGQKTLTISKKSSKSGTCGNADGSYQYNDDSPSAGLKTAQIEPQ